MKKFMIGMLIIIPIIIMVTVATVSVIVSTTAYIGVDSVSIDKDYVSIDFGQEYYDLTKYISIEVLPVNAKNKDLTFTIDDITCYDSDYEENWQNGDVSAPVSLVNSEHIDVNENSTGIVRVDSICSFSLYVQAEQMSDHCVIYVGNSKVQSVSIVGAESIEVGESAMLNTTFYPSDSVASKIEWLSSDNSILTIDKNGIIYAVSQGQATITARAYNNDNSYVEGNYQVVVNASQTKYGNSIKTSLSLLSFETLGISASSVSNANGCTILENGIQIDNDTATFDVDGKTVTIEKCGSDDIEIAYKNILTFDENNANQFVLAVGDGLYLTAKWADRFREGAPTVTWESSKTSVATITDGYLFGNASGMTEITAKCGDKKDTIVVAVEHKVINLILENTDSSIAKQGGIAREIVIASRRYTDVESGAFEDNSYAINFVVPTIPEDAKAFYKAFDFSAVEIVEDEDGNITEVATDKVYFVDNKVYADADKIDSVVSIKITVKARYPKYENIRKFTEKSFTIKFADAMAVYDQATIVKATNDKYNVCLEADIELLNPTTFADPSNPDKGYHKTIVTLDSDMYGNNHKVYSHRDDIVYRACTMFYVIDRDNIISNVRLTINNEVPEEITSGDEEMAEMRGVALIYMGHGADLGEESQNSNARLEYSIIENGSMCVQVYNTDLTIDGCIMRNTLEFAIWMVTSLDYNEVEGYYHDGQVIYSNLTLKNIVMSNMISTAFNFQYCDYAGKNGDGGYPEQAAQAIAEGKNSSVTQIGFLDVYNWQQLNTLDLASAINIGDDRYQGIISSLSTFVGDAIATSESMLPYRYTYERCDYFHFGGLSTGITDNSLIEIKQWDDDRWQMLDADFFKSTDETLLKQLGNLDIKFWCYLADKSDITPEMTYSVNNKLIAHLHGEN